MRSMLLGRPIAARSYWRREALSGKDLAMPRAGPVRSGCGHVSGLLVRRTRAQARRREPRSLLVVTIVWFFRGDRASPWIRFEFHPRAVLDAFAFPLTIVSLKLRNLCIAGLHSFGFHLFGRHPIRTRLIGVGKIERDDPKHRSERNCTHEQLAGMLGIGRSYASRVLENFKPSGSSKSDAGPSDP
jgi:hypothetical protein